MCLCSINIKGLQVYPVPPWCFLVWRCWLPVACMPPLGWPLFRCWHLCSYSFSLCLVLIIGRGGGVGWWGCGDVMWWVLTWTEPIPPCLLTDFVCRYPWSSDAPMGGPHQSDSNPTLDVSTRFREGAQAAQTSRQIWKPWICLSSRITHLSQIYRFQRVQWECLSMQTDRFIVHMYRSSYGIPIVSDVPNTLTRQSFGTNDAPRDPLNGPFTCNHYRKRPNLRYVYL